MQNPSPLSHFLPNNISAANGDDDWRIKPFDMFSSSHSFCTTRSALEIEYNGSPDGVTATFKLTLLLMPGQYGGSQCATIVLNSRKNSFNWQRTISSRGYSSKFFTSIASSILYSTALRIGRFPSFTVRKKDNSSSITIFSWNCQWGQIFGLNSSSTGKYNGLRSSSITCCAFTGPLWLCGMHFHNPHLTVLEVN